GRRLWIALNAIQKARRNQNRLQREGDSLLQRISLLTRQVDVSQVLLHFAGGRRTAERARGEARQNRARACVRVFSRGMAADKNSADVLRRRARRLIERA